MPESIASRDMGEKGISFFLNGKKHTVDARSEKYCAETSLSEYIRSAGLKGTKVVCKEAGCGACAVVVTVPDASSSAFTTSAINSCLCPLLSVDGWQITTVEGVGNQRDGFHPIQQRLAEANGSQCGYCSPGVVMTMYGLLNENPRPVEQEIEDSFDGNLCRCTGYRAILDSMKTFATDNKSPNQAPIDIEELGKKLCPATKKACVQNSTQNTPVATSDGCVDGSHGPMNVRPLHIRFKDAVWERPLSLADLQKSMQEFAASKVRLVCGNTSVGILKNEGPFEVYIDISCVKELKEVKVGETSVRVGASVTLTSLINQLQTLQGTKPGFQYFKHLVKHLKLCGSVLLRNAASIGGNLYLKQAHPGFPSDVFTMLEAAGASVTIWEAASGKEREVSLVDLVQEESLAGKVLTTVQIPALDPLDHFRSFKIAPRAQNSHAYVNAAFKIKVSADGKQVLGKPSLVFGGVSRNLVHSQEGEAYFTGKELTEDTITEGLCLIRSAAKESAGPNARCSDYHLDLAVSLLYKTLLGVMYQSDPRQQSGSVGFERPVSSALQTFEEKAEDWPLKQPMPKTTALIQTSGEALFINDMPRYQEELSAAFVLATVGNAYVESVDPAPALALAGVVRYLSAADVPCGGQNIVAPWSVFDFEVEEVLSSGRIGYAGQPIGVILAESQTLADRAAQKVVVKYRDVQTPILTIQQGIAANSFHPPQVQPITIGDPDSALGKASNVLEGEVSMGTQYHFYLENQISLCVPSEDGMEVYSSTQYSDMVQASVAAFLGKSTNYVNVHVPRLGGAFGGKQFTSVYPASAAALAAHCTGRPVRLAMSLSANMALAGKRFPVLAKYKVGYTDEGKLEVVMVDIYADGGAYYSCSAMLNEVVVHMDHGYYVPNWKIRAFNVKTHKATNLACRSPGPVPALLIIESVLEHVAHAIGKHPIAVKELNLFQQNQTDLGGHVLTYCTMREVWTQLKALADVDSRIAQVQAFNQNNRWKKRGLTMNGIKHGMFWAGTGFPAQVSIFANDGTVSVSQGGVEMGQGLYTKIAQATAHALGIPVSLVKVRPNQSLIANNAMLTGGSTTSEQCIYAVQQCCQTLRERMSPVQAKFPDADWPTLCRKALEAKVDLGARYTNFGSPGSPHFNYFVYCAGVFETEVDVLTGEFLLRRVDIMFDCGESLNPLIDLGQIEGAFIMGLGYHVMEDIDYDPGTGRVRNDGTWEYNIPTTKDIPVDWRIYLLSGAPNPVGINSSKAVGEPPVAMGCGPALAIRQAMEAAVLEHTGKAAFITMDSPLTVEKIHQGCKASHVWRSDAS